MDTPLPICRPFRQGVQQPTFVPECCVDDEVGLIQEVQGRHADRKIQHLLSCALGRLIGFVSPRVVRITAHHWLDEGSFEHAIAILLIAVNTNSGRSPFILFPFGE